MKNLFLILLVCLAGMVFGQEPPSCTVNAGNDQTIIVTDDLNLQAEVSDNTFNHFWAYLSGPMAPDQVTVQSPNELVTAVLVNGNWAIGTYTFQFCTDCKDEKSETGFTRICDEVVIVVDDAECSVDAGPNLAICENESMVLNASPSQDHTGPPHMTWTFLGGSGGANVATPNNYSTLVTPAPGPNWATGVYNFRFCAQCRDFNGDGVFETPCDEMQVEVLPIPPQATISPASTVACHTTSFTVNAPGPGNLVAYSYEPFDGLVNLQLVGDQLIATHSDIQGATCDYTITYSIYNDGCPGTSATATVRFINPYDPDRDGTIEGYVDACPSCSQNLNLVGHFPGCGGQGTWTGTGPGSVTITYSDPATGFASVTVGSPGTYTFTYTVTNIAPCPPSTFTVTCQVFDIGTFNIGSNQYRVFCGNILPAGTYPFTFNNLPNTVYNWTVNQPNPNPGITFSNPHGSSSSVIVPADVDLSGGPVIIRVVGQRLYVDPDCDGPLGYELVTLPFTDPTANWNFVQDLMANTPDSCWAVCQDVADIRFQGAPVAEVETEDVVFLCSDCTENIRLDDYFDVVNNVVYGGSATVVSQPAGSSLPSTVPINNFITLNRCGDYRFYVEIFSYSSGISPQQRCYTRFYLNFTVREEQPISCGTNQEGCYNEPIRLVANNPYGAGIVGTWTQVNCPAGIGCTATFSDPHDPNTQVFHGLEFNQLPANLCFEWSFESEGANCNPSCTTCVQINPCWVDCPQITVTSICRDGNVILAAFDQNGFEIDPGVYDLVWDFPGTTIPSASGNPVSVPYPGATFNYELTAFLILDGDMMICVSRAQGEVTCEPPLPCNIRIDEECLPNGMAQLTIIDLATGLPVVPLFTDNDIRWYINGVSQGYGDQNPIVVPPNACYSLDADFYIYADDAPHWPGTWTEICRVRTERKCLDLKCGCEEVLPGFIVAGYGDATATSMNLQFPPNSYPVCGSFYSTWGTLGIFHLDGTPVTDFSQFTITWESGATGTYVTGSIQNNDVVTITSVLDPNCSWPIKYVRVCCDQAPSWVHCENPIVKKCNPDGTVVYYPQPTQIVWTHVPGAIGYEIEVTHGVSSECCSDPAAPSVETFTDMDLPYAWVIPPGYTCFTVRVKPIFSSTLCRDAVWSDPYEYCAEGTYCETVIIVCGCCGGGGRPSGDRDENGLQTVMVPESEINAMLNANPGPQFFSLEEAIGRATATEAVFDIFPNPANELIEVKTANLKTGFYDIVLKDLLGREWQRVRAAGNSSKQLDVRQLPQGIFWLNIEDATGQRLHSEKISILR